MLLTMFFSAFLAATLLPGGSELILAGFIRQDCGLIVSLVVVAVIGNTLGALTSYGLGYVGRKAAREKESRKKSYQYSLQLFEKYGCWSLLLSWVPVIGDFLCVFAGWTRCRLLPSVVMIFTGKAVRYVLVAFAAISWL